jgi:heme-degrading monooxygenase HmoA
MKKISRRKFIESCAFAGTLFAGFDLVYAQNAPAQAPRGTPPAQQPSQAAPQTTQATSRFVSIVSSKPTVDEAKKIRSFQAGFLPRMIKAPGILAICVFARPAAGDERLATVWESEKALTAYQASALCKEEAAFEATMSTAVTREQYPMINFMTAPQPSTAAPQSTQTAPKFFSIVSAKPTTAETPKMRSFQAAFLPRMIKAPGILAILVYARPAAGDERLACVWESEKALAAYQASTLGKEEATFETTLSTAVTKEQYPLINYL